MMAIKKKPGDKTSRYKQSNTTVYDSQWGCRAGAHYGTFTERPQEDEKSDNEGKTVTSAFAWGEILQLREQTEDNGGPRTMRDEKCWVKMGRQ